jgi:hypothetical protein
MNETAKLAVWKGETSSSHPSRVWKDDILFRFRFPYLPKPQWYTRAAVKQENVKMNGGKNPAPLFLRKKKFFT